ncbi:PREDICTED: dol-P-Man:Man(6)GlcNAc(2)-PP-Dol alpha-1,2-mannosyltransferase-like [Populus euphratica]|uniref:Dol-P-Man:Man(6)GlcNAc(2)-PP-Dol alpha-1,2-mannosyltransferase-like n=1 Tax=Populus euphratica TaxID=75702 RepID=A0AAJ6X4W3_POPEU|nr:PREDICTED: dol-P-Man:Man(6)GlcNAc(2)-PP-Dol alpha-1,2-mannosyltransferase-like [Populus euphratica]
MSLQPHEEEGFLYPIYLVVCVAASAVIGSFPDLFRDKYNPQDNSWLVLIAKFVRPVVLGLILSASQARTFSLINGCGARIEVYKILEHDDDVGKGMIYFVVHCKNVLTDFIYRAVLLLLQHVVLKNVICCLRPSNS